MKIKRVVAALSVMGILCAGVAVVSLRAAEQKPTPNAKAPPPAARAPGVNPASPAPKPSLGGPEDDATIKDDPTVAPDSQESADSSVSFPADI